MRVAPSRSPLAHQRYACTTRPPSIGYPGSRLNRAMTALPCARVSSGSCSHIGAPDRLAKTKRAENDALSRTLMAGPDSPSAISDAGVLGSSPSCATPPNTNSVILCTGTPLLRATSE